jgi:hypothetical protein
VRTSALNGFAARQPGAAVSPPNRMLTNLSDWRDFCVTKACSLFILDKGKPVARPGRKAKGRRTVSVGSLATERVMQITSASGDEGVCCYTWDPEGDTQASVGCKNNRRFTRRTPTLFVIPVGSRLGAEAGMEEYR